MIKINIVCVGKLKEKYYEDAVQDYFARISKFCKLEVFELQEEKLPTNPSLKQIEQALEQEGKMVIKNLKGYTYVCDVLGSQMDSVEFSKHLIKNYESADTVTFVIGSSFGLANAVKEAANFKISFSKCTFPHHLMRVVLMEQIFRALCINNNVTYHK